MQHVKELVAMMEATPILPAEEIFGSYKEPDRGEVVIGTLPDDMQHAFSAVVVLYKEMIETDKKAKARVVEIDQLGIEKTPELGQELRQLENDVAMAKCRHDLAKKIELRTHFPEAVGAGCVGVCAGFRVTMETMGAGHDEDCATCAVQEICFPGSGNGGSLTGLNGLLGSLLGGHGIVIVGGRKSACVGRGKPGPARTS